jgi:hypothetical protein
MASGRHRPCVHASADHALGGRELECNAVNPQSAACGNVCT